MNTSIDKPNPKYTYRRNGIFYFSRSVPKDLRDYYSTDRIVISLHTRSFRQAVTASQRLSFKLDDDWLDLRLSRKHDIFAPYTYDTKTTAPPSTPLFGEASENYLRVKGSNRPKTFIQTVTRCTKYLVSNLGDRNLESYSGKDAADLRDKLLDQGLATTSVRRVFNTVKAIISLNISEFGLSITNPFTNTYFADDTDASKRSTIDERTRSLITTRCNELDDDIRRIILIAIDTGMRLSEIIGLKREDIKLDKDVPYLIIRPNSRRRLKTKNSERLVPLVSSALKALQSVIQDNANSEYCFPRYLGEESVNSNSASAAINKWLKNFDNNIVLHGFRHTMRDRLRKLDMPSEMIDQICGWSSSSVGQRYGNGYSIEQLHGWMLKLD